jgi:uncharacterized protein
LEVFGSAARADDFNPASSDADFLVEFAPDAQPRLNAFFGAKADLEKLLGCGVDLVETGAVRNPYILASMNRNREAVYEAYLCSVIRVPFCGVFVRLLWPFNLLRLAWTLPRTPATRWRKRPSCAGAIVLIASCAYCARAGLGFNRKYLSRPVFEPTLPSSHSRNLAVGTSRE